MRSNHVPANFNKKVSLVTNNYRLALQNTNIQLHMYNLQIEPELPDTSKIIN